MAHVSIFSRWILLHWTSGTVLHAASTRDLTSAGRVCMPACMHLPAQGISYTASHVVEIPPSRQARRLSLASAARTLDAGMDFAAMLRSKTFLPYVSAFLPLMFFVSFTMLHYRMSKAVIVLEKGYDAENVIKQTRFKHPVFVLNHEGLGIDIPHNITLETVVDLLGYTRA